MIKKLYITSKDDGNWTFRLRRKEQPGFTHDPSRDCYVDFKPENLKEVITISIPDADAFLCADAVELFVSALWKFNHLTPYTAGMNISWLSFDPELKVFMNLAHDNPFSREQASPTNLFIMFPAVDPRKNGDWVPLPWETYQITTINRNTTPNTTTTPNVQNKGIEIDEAGIYFKFTTGEIVFRKIGG